MDHENIGGRKDKDSKKALSACVANKSCPFKLISAIGFVDDRPFMINTQRVGIGQRLFIGNQDIGRLSEVRPDRILVRNDKNISACYKIGNPDFALITTSPTKDD